MMHKNYDHRRNSSASEHPKCPKYDSPPHGKDERWNLGLEYYCVRM